MITPSLVVIDQYLRADAIETCIVAAEHMRFIEVKRITPALQDGEPPVMRDYDVFDGQKITNYAPSLWSIYDSILDAVRATMHQTVLGKLYPRADFVLKRYRLHQQQSWHRDTNPIGAVLYLTQCEGGATDFGTMSVSPKPGRLAIFNGHIQHAAAPVLDGEKLAFICNFYYPGPPSRPKDADRLMLDAG